MHSANPQSQMCIGDAIVWWRARMLYPGNKKIRYVCCILLSGTFGRESSCAFAVPLYDGCCRIRDYVDGEISVHER